jgi:hypothetical protein
MLAGKEALRTMLQRYGFFEGLFKFTGKIVFLQSSKHSK